MVPKEWKIKTIGDIATVSSGGTPNRKEQAYWNGDIPWVTTAEVQFKTILDSAEKITKEGLTNSSAKLFPINTILMAMYGQGKTRGQVAKLGIEASTNQACAAIILSSDYCVDYYYHFLIYQYENIRNMSNSGSQENLSGSIVKSIPVLVPPYFEQEKIAQILSTWDQAISATEKLLENSQQQKKALMQQLLTGKKRLLDDDGVRFSATWLSKSLKDISKVSIGLVTTMTEHYVESGIPLIRNSDIKENRITKEKLIKLSEDFANQNSGRKLSKGDVVTVHTGEVGVSAVIDDELDGCLGFATLNTRPNKKIIDAQFLCWYFNSSRFIAHCISLSTGDGRQNLNLKDFSKVMIPVPSLLEQKKIASALSLAAQEMETLQKRLDCLKREKKALMQQLLTGKKRVKVAA